MASDQRAPAKAFTWGIGVLYFGLGVRLVHARPVSEFYVCDPIGVVDNLFHLLLLPGIAHRCVRAAAA
jgi:hypothetical protein